MFKTTETRKAEQWRNATGASEIARALADETPIGILYNGKPHVVMMATPSDVADLAIGFTITERIAPYDRIEEVRVEERAEGINADVILTKEAQRDVVRARVRTLEGRSSCGLCGVQRLKSAVRPLSDVGEGFSVTRKAIQRAIDRLDTMQDLGQATRATHAAAWADAGGEILLMREDVGRHNALDKLVGAAARAGLDPAQAFAIITSRCSYEMVEKAAMAGLSILAAVSAPTALAVRKAEEAGLTLIALARADGHTVFTRPDRVKERRVREARRETAKV